MRSVEIRDGVFLDDSGWVGGTMAALAYVLVSTRRRAAADRRFELVNVFGGILLAAAALDAGATAAIDDVWIVSGCCALFTPAVRAVRRPASIGPKIGGFIPDRSP
ncbi:hypothetical protein LRS71_25470 [Rhodococcus pyridinivorans]|uniref:hypothetical protein n=1 Tax=Rhodococcus pyridinivorans TaxID=103816 RepID=UPI001E63A77F|nr:hypothetical protein [Rhodococcus pyridinivorans]MCD5422857.1 hypothetical protein [Rhodococcus pyridinivorans]